MHGRRENLRMAQGRFYDRKVWKELRQQILRRDGYQCVRCHCYVGGKNMARVDHIEPLTIAPSRALDPGNLRTLCAACDNRAHSEKTLHLPYRVDRMVHGNNELGFPNDASHPWNTAGLGST